MDKLLLNKYARTIVRIGVNVQPGQEVSVTAPVEAKELIREIVKEAYLAGAKYCHVRWNDPYCAREGLLGASLETLSEVRDFDIKFLEYAVNNRLCNISITSPIPSIYADVDPVKMRKAGLPFAMASQFYQEHFMNNKSQWNVAAFPNAAWAKKVFPDLEESLAIEKLLEAILAASHVTLDNDPVAEWDKINRVMKERNENLNSYAFKNLHFTNSLGTDLVVGLVDGHIWAGGGENTTCGEGVNYKTYFNPNIPTEENFTMPHNKKTDGIVYSSKPLDYQGKLIENFWLKFEGGKVVDFRAEKNVEALKALVEYDEGSCRLGEVALLSYDSPISLMNILFYNTLFDENASCHLALGRSYGATNLRNALQMTDEELESNGSNNSKTHVDFMFGSRDMKIVGSTPDGKKIVIMENGNLVI